MKELHTTEEDKNENNYAEETVSLAKAEERFRQSKNH